MSLVVGVPTEVKSNENRVAITPDALRELSLAGVEVLVQAGAGDASSFTDNEMAEAGARVVPTAAEIWGEADLVCKVKEPQPFEVELMRPGQLLFAFLHLAAYPDVAHALLERQVTALAYETVHTGNGMLPLLAPMSEVAGRLVPQIGAHFLEREHGGRGVLLGGVPGVRPARVVVVGAGNVGWHAARVAAGMGAEVVLLDKDLNRLRQLDETHQARMFTVASNQGSVERSVAEADLLVGAVLVAGARAPVVVSEAMVKQMPARSVIVDVAIDQGGCIEGMHETTHDAPVFIRHDVLHYGVGNIPGAVPRTSTFALTNATLPYLTALATQGLEGACRTDPALAQGVNTYDGDVTHPAVAAALNLPFTERF